MPHSLAPACRQSARARGLAAVVSIAVLTATPSLGQEGRWTLRAEGILLAPNDQRVVAHLGGDGSGAEATYGLDGEGVGIGIGLEYRLSRRVGLDLSVASVDLQTVLRTERTGGTIEDRESAAFELYVAGVEWHLLPERRLELTVGAFAAMTKLDDLVFLTELGESEKLTFDDDVGFGASLGVDFPVSADGRWRLTGKLRFLKTILESDSGDTDLDLDPSMLTIGAGYRF